MSSINPKENRDVIPNWRSYKKTAYAGELYTASSTQLTLPVFPLTQYIESWKENQSLAFAGDLISAAILNEQTTLPDVIRAAQYIINSEEAPHIIKDIATTIVSSKVSDEHITSSESSQIIREIEQRKAVTSETIKFIKKANKHFPYNPIAYCELSRCYLSLGQYDKAKDAIKIALHLAPYSRYISRCAARLFIQTDELDLAHSVIVKNPAFRQDPWLIASEIAINTSMGRNSKYVNIGKKIIASQKFSTFSCSELSSAIGTLEMANGSRKKCVEFINRALVQPNDNSLAQAEWLAGENRDLRFKFNNYSNLRFKSEADARCAYTFLNFVEAYKYAVLWLEDSPYDKSAILFSSHIAYCFLKDYEAAEKILKIGLVSNPNDNSMLNNLAYVNALNGNIPDAEKYYDRLSRNLFDVDSDAKICQIATNGLIQFRKGAIDIGRKLYHDAILLAKDSAKDRSLINKAILNYLREELVANACSVSDVMDLLSKIDTSQDKEMVRLSEDVIEEAKKRSKSLVINPFKIDFNLL